jgi:hypothetical protein
MKPEKVKLSEIQTLTLVTGKLTNARRVASVKQVFIYEV